MSVKERNASIQHVTCIRTSEKEASFNFKRMKLMEHPNASEQKCVIRCMFG